MPEKSRVQWIRFPELALAVAAIFIPVDLSKAETAWMSAQSMPVEVDLYMLPARILRLIKEDAVGTARSWDCVNGRHVEIRLIGGGVRAHAKVAAVRVTTIAGQDKTIVTFRYRKDARRGWVSVGCDQSRSGNSWRRAQALRH